MSISAPRQPPPPQQPQRPPGPGGGTYNAQLHPRGRGGKWIVTKGAGYGAGGPDQTTQQLQQRLQQLGFHVPSDGKFGPATEEAVKAFQQRYGLDPSGGVDAATVELLQTPPDHTLAQVRASNAATRKELSTAARKTATTKAKAKAAAATARTRAVAQTAGGQRSAAIKRTPGTIPGTSAAVPGVGHLGTGMLTHGTGMTGASNKAVSNLQAALNQAGYSLNKDGRFGPQTEAAVKKLQKDYGLTADGIVGPATKALLLGLGSAPTKTISKANANATGAAPPLPGEVATLRTQAPHPRHGSRTAGSRMQLKGPPAKPAVLKYSASDLPDPDLEETTLAFGVGGQPSMSIKDARPAPQPTPLADQPVWNRQQAVADPPDYTIPDGRPVPAAPVDTTIDDGRDQKVDVMALLQEAIAARQAATDGRSFARALARERVLRERLTEAGAYSEALHPRGRGGKWEEVLGKLKGLAVNKPDEIHGVTSMRLSTGHYAAAIPPNGFIHDRSPERVAKAIADHVGDQEQRRAHGERAVRGLSTGAASHFTHDWALRGDPEGLPERHEMWSQVHSEDPKGYVRSVFSQQMTPEIRAEAEQALNTAKEHHARNQAAPYFDLSKPHEMVPIDSLRPTKTDPESSYQNAAKRMDTAARGGMDKRKPVTAQVGGDGRLLLVDGHATVEALRRKGITHAPVDIRPRASNLDPSTSKEAIREQARLDRAAIAVEKHQRSAEAARRVTDKALTAHGN